EVFDGIVQAAVARGQNVTVFNVGNWKDACHLIPTYCDGRVDGLILLAPTIEAPVDEWLPGHAPLVAVHPNTPLPGIPCLRSDDEGGAFAAVSHLLRLGHRRILHIGGPEGMTGADLRLQGYQRAYREAGIEMPEGHIVRTAFTAEGGRVAVENWLQAHCGQAMPHAIFAGSDAIALGCLERLQVRGLRVPEDISLIGFDNTLFARAARLSTVAQPLNKLGRLAVQDLLDLIEGRNAEASSAAPSAPSVADATLPTEFCDRSTLAAVRREELLIA
ncbi:MAG TPA: substrate-binding domain-containing protein, partial [Burkholderiaceae bacterium]|nr:substrate-binding domain-containing protein [Burkholderiaceae bacterium]